MYGGAYVVTVDSSGHTTVENKGPSDDASFTALLNLFVLVPVVLIGLAIAVGIWGNERGWHEPIAVGVVVLLVALTIIVSVPFMKLYNKLAKHLYRVIHAQIDLAVFMAQRGVVLEDVVAIAEMAARHERRIHVAIAKARSMADPFALGVVNINAAPDLKVVMPFERAQEVTAEMQSESGRLWQAWSEAARAYADMRCTFPFFAVAWVVNKLTNSNRFPLVTDTLYPDRGPD